MDERTDMKYWKMAEPLKVGDFVFSEGSPAEIMGFDNLDANPRLVAAWIKYVASGDYATTYTDVLSRAFETKVAVPIVEGDWSKGHYYTREFVADPDLVDAPVLDRQVSVSSNELAFFSGLEAR